MKSPMMSETQGSWKTALMTLYTAVYAAKGNSQ